MMRAVLLSTILLALSSCVTTFTGSPKVSDGPAGCKAKGSSWGMELTGMVAMGDYSDGCICQIPSAQQKAAGGVPAAGIAMAGVWIQTQREQSQAARPIPAPHR